jgi:hypothetical protein
MKGKARNNPCLVPLILRRDMRRVVLLVIASLVCMAANADGISFVGGRYPRGPVSELLLSPNQIQFIDLFRKCAPDNTKTPYVFRLTAEQAYELKTQVGFAPTRFAIVEGFRGAEGDELKINVVNRFSEDRFEILHETLTRDNQARQWEMKVMGWGSSPFLRATPSQLNSGKCPR